MVFFPSTKDMLAFADSGHMAEFKAENCVRVITEAIDPCEKEGSFLKATEAGAVTLMIREFGRGTDFKCFDNKVLSAGGVHVLQAFYSNDISEEIQLKGRAARQGADGSFRYVEMTCYVSESRFEELQCSIPASFVQHGAEYRTAEG